MVDRMRALGLPLLGALLALTASLLVFSVIAEDVVGNEIRADQRLADWLHNRAADPVTDVFRVVTFLGSFVTLVAASLAAAVVLWRRSERAEAVFVALAFVGAQVLTNGMKLAFRRDRPSFPDPLATATTYSFPSGHALVSLAVYGALALIIARRLSSPVERALLFVGTGVLVFAIGFSRLYLGVHYLSDMVAGFAIGIAWLSLLYVALEVRGRYTTRYRAPAKQ
jgi:membrane-associated phospholipid phosphatase